MAELDTKQQVEVFINDRISEASLYASEAWLLLEPYMLTMQNAYTAIDVPEVPSDTIVFPEYTFDPSAISEVPAEPDVDMTMPSTADPILQKVAVDLIEVDELPEFSAEAPGAVISYTNTNYVSALLESLTTKLEASIESGTGISSDVENAIYERAKTRLLDDYTNECDEIQDRYSASGMVTLTGAMNAQLDRAKRKYDRSLLDLGRDILTQASNLEQENVKHAQTVTVQMEALLVDLHNSSESRKLDIAKTNVSNAIQAYATAAQVFGILMEGYKSKAESMAVLIGTQVETNKTNAQIYSAELEAKKINVGIVVEEAKARADVYRSLMSGYEARTRLMAAVEDVKIKEFMAKGDQAVKNAEILLKRAEVSIQTAINKLSMQVEAAKTGANVTAQIIASALNSVKTQASLGYDGSSRHQHTYDETKSTPEGPERRINISYEDSDYSIDEQDTALDIPGDAN